MTTDYDAASRICPKLREENRQLRAQVEALSSLLCDEHRAAVLAGARYAGCLHCIALASLAATHSTPFVKLSKD